MAKGFADIDSQCREITENVRKGIFSPVYLLMGEEPFYIDRICDEIIEHALEEDQRDFNQTICYGTDTDVPSVI
ncbi:MAG: DNA polymerase III subunit delta, partial [Candidatus Cryptobacteroides sp.]